MIDLKGTKETAADIGVHILIYRGMKDKFSSGASMGDATLCQADLPHPL